MNELQLIFLIIICVIVILIDENIIALKFLDKLNHLIH